MPLQSTKNKSKLLKNGRIRANGRDWDAEKLKKFRVYQTDYNARSYRMYGFRLRQIPTKEGKPAQTDIIEWLDSKDALNDYLVTLIKNDMAKSKARKTVK